MLHRIAAHWLAPGASAMSPPGQASEARLGSRRPGEVDDCGEMADGNAPNASGFDLKAIKAVLSVGGVLEALGKDPGRKGRTVCPYANGNNPTAFKYDDHRFFCFRCGIGGDVFHLVQRLRGCDFVSAVRFCADLAGIIEGTVTPERVRREIEERRREQEARRAERRRQQQRFEGLLSELFDVEADIKLIEGIWSRDPEILSPLTASALNDLAGLYLRREVLEWGVECCLAEPSRRRSPSSGAREPLSGNMATGLTTEDCRHE